MTLSDDELIDLPERSSEMSEPERLARGFHFFCDQLNFTAPNGMKKTRRRTARRPCRRRASS